MHYTYDIWRLDCDIVVIHVIRICHLQPWSHPSTGGKRIRIFHRRRTDPTVFAPSETLGMDKMPMFSIQLGGEHPFEVSISQHEAAMLMWTFPHFHTFPACFCRFTVWFCSSSSHKPTNCRLMMWSEMPMGQSSRRKWMGISLQHVRIWQVGNWSIPKSTGTASTWNHEIPIAGEFCLFVTISGTDLLEVPTLAMYLCAYMYNYVYIIYIHIMRSMSGLG